MPDIPPIDAEFAELLEAVANRDLTPVQHERLSTRLTEDPDARAAFIRETAFDAMLMHEFPSPEPRVAPSALEIPENETEPETSSSPPATCVGCDLLSGSV